MLAHSATEFSLVLVSSNLCRYFLLRGGAMRPPPLFSPCRSRRRAAMDAVSQTRRDQHYHTCSESRRREIARSRSSDSRSASPIRRNTALIDTSPLLYTSSLANWTTTDYEKREDEGGDVGTERSRPVRTGFAKRTQVRVAGPVRPPECAGLAEGCTVRRRCNRRLRRTLRHARTAALSALRATQATRRIRIWLPLLPLI
jgi:hypothetical protein